MPNLPSTQWAAVITHLELITTAPQLWLPWNLNPACNNAMEFFMNEVELSLNLVNSRQRIQGI